MSIAPREQKWRTRSTSCAGHEAFVQRAIGSPSGWSTSAPQTGQCVGSVYSGRFALRSSQHRADDARDHVAGADHGHDVADADVVVADVVLVVQRRVGDGRAADLHRLEHGVGVEHAGAADADHDVEQLRARVARAELVGDRPARVFAGGAELRLQREVVDLDHDAVDLVVERLALRLPIRVTNATTSRIESTRARVLVDRKAQRAQIRPAARAACAAARRRRSRRARRRRTTAGARRSSSGRAGAARRRRCCAGWRRSPAARRARFVEPGEVALAQVGFAAHVDVARHRDFAVAQRAAGST